MINHSIKPIWKLFSRAKLFVITDLDSNKSLFITTKAIISFNRLESDSLLIRTESKKRELHLGSKKAVNKAIKQLVKALR